MKIANCTMKLTTTLKTFFVFFPKVAAIFVYYVTFQKVFEKRVDNLNYVAILHIFRPFIDRTSAFSKFFH